MVRREMMQTDPPQQARPAGLQRIGRYRIVRPLSKGGMALVYEARLEGKEGVSPRVAIKLILPEHAGSETFKELFINEARLGASMAHQNLVRIQDFDAEDDNYFLVMEYVEGFTLRKIIALADKHGLTIPMGVVAEIGRQACDGLHFAHTAVDEHGSPLHLVHRDIKPSNLILNPHGVVKVLDFGISKGRLREEKRGSVKGTWGYMAPEQAIGADIGPTADVFGLATVLYELGALRPMFLDRPKEEIRRLLRDDHAARMAATLDGHAYGPLIGVLVRALQRDPAARFASGEDFGRALSSLLPDPITARDEVVRFYTQLEALDAGKASVPSASVRGHAPSPATGGSGGSLAPVPSRRSGRSRQVNNVVTFVAGATLSVALLMAVSVVGLAVLGAARSTRPGEPNLVPIAAGTPPAPEGAEPTDEPDLAVDEPAGPAGEGAPGEERPPPVVRRTPPRPRTRKPTPSSGNSDEETDESEEDDVITIVRPAPDASEGDGTSDEGSTSPAPEGAIGTLIVDSKQPAEVYIAGQFVDQAPVKKDLPVGRYAVSLVAADGRRRTFDVDIEADQKIRKVWDFDKMEWR